MFDRIDRDLGKLTRISNLRTYRQELLASNIANADTPNYKARDIDFKSALAGAMGATTSSIGLPMTRTHDQHLAAASDEAWYSAAVKYRTEYQPAVDGNTVNMDVERSAFAENAVQLEAALTFIREKLRGLQTAIQGQ